MEWKLMKQTNLQTWYAWEEHYKQHYSEDQNRRSPGPSIILIEWVKYEETAIINTLTLLINNYCKNCKNVKIPHEWKKGHKSMFKMCNRNDLGLFWGISVFGEYTPPVLIIQQLAEKIISITTLLFLMASSWIAGTSRNSHIKPLWYSRLSKDGANSNFLDNYLGK